MAGPAYLTATGFYSEETPDNRITDSKKLSESTREILFVPILNSCDYLDVQEITVSDINTLGLGNIYNNIMEAMIRRASKVADKIIIDGNKPFPNTKVVCYPKADLNYWQVSSASIVAKVIRDRVMNQLGEEVSLEYKWSINKGYGTKDHMEAIKKLGVTRHHRTSFNFQR